MSLRARLLTQASGVLPVSWADLAAQAAPASYDRARPEPAWIGIASAHASAAGPSTPSPALSAAAEQDAFARGFAQGERAGAEAAGHGNAVLQGRLTASLGELVDLRARVVRQSERDMVQLALAIARRVAQREVSLDRQLLVAMARVALDRLADANRVTIRVHPSDFDVFSAARQGELAGDHLSVVADTRVERGGCRLESECGSVEAGVDAQIRELARALLGDDEGGTHAART